MKAVSEIHTEIKPPGHLEAAKLVGGKKTWEKHRPPTVRSHPPRIRRADQTLREWRLGSGRRTLRGFPGLGYADIRRLRVD